MKIKNNIRNIVICLMGVVAVFLLTGIYWFRSYTLGGLYSPLICLVMAALVSGLFMWNARFWFWLTGSSKFWVNYLCHSFCVGTLVLAVFYGGNYIYADDDAGHHEKAVVEKKYYKVRHKSRRVGRNRYIPDGTYNVYYMEVKFASGCVRDVSITHNQYARMHGGDSVSLFVSRGFFRIPVIKSNKGITLHRNYGHTKGSF